MEETSAGHGFIKRLWRQKFGMTSIDQYFLTEKCPFSQKRQFKTKNLKIAAVVGLVATVFAILYFGGSAEKELKKTEAAAIKNEDLPHEGVNSRNTEGSVSMEGSWSGHDGNRGSISMGARTGMGGSSRQYTASQVVRAGSDGSGSGFGLPMGSTIQVKLLNTLLSSDSSQPVVALVLEDAAWRNSTLIPAGTKAVGNASFDDAAKRLQVRFHTFVYPEGDQHSVSALGLIGDGSSGLPGDYHSGYTQKEIGRFVGNFVGGLADGMKDRQAGGTSGIAFEPGSVKNGILNGITVSSLDQAKAFSENMQNVHPFLEVPGGSVFLLYFEKEYSP